MEAVVDQDEILRQEALKEIEAEKQPAKEEPETPPEPEETKAEPVEEKVEEPKAEEPPKEEVKPEETTDPVKEWAQKHGLTEDEAKEDFEKTKSVVSKYKSPEEMARALRMTQSAYDKMKAEAGKEKEPEVFQPSPNPQLEVVSWVNQNREKLIDAYRTKYPNKSADMTDEAIIEEQTDRVLSDFQVWQERQVLQVKDQASRRRQELLSSVEEDDKVFLNDIRAVLDKTQDSVILSRSFNLNDIARWARGDKKRWQEAEKAAEERGYKRALEEKRIVGVVPTSKPKAPEAKKSSNSMLSELEKNRAREMFFSAKMTDEEKFEAYTDIVKKRKK